METNDIWVLLILVVGILVFISLRIRARIRALEEPEDEWLQGLLDDHVPDSPSVQLLNAQGYHILGGKRRLPIQIEVNDAPPLGARLFIDYVVSKEDEYWIVKVARERKPLEWTGTGLRDQLLVYRLLWPQVAGVIVVDPARQRVDRVTFVLGEQDQVEEEAGE